MNNLPILVISDGAGFVMELIIPQYPRMFTTHSNYSMVIAGAGSCWGPNQSVKPGSRRLCIQIPFPYSVDPMSAV